MIIEKDKKTRPRKTKGIKPEKTIRGRIFSSKDINLIKRIVKNKYALGRTKISLEVCNVLNWVQPNGWPKDRACRDVLIYLEKNDFIKLPPQKTKRTYKKRTSTNNTHFIKVDATPISSLDFSSLKLIQVKGCKDEKLWNWLVNKYHYLGFNVFVGRSLKYLVSSNDKIIGAIGWCDPAWSVSARDIILQKAGFDKICSRRQGINNGRFLILPWVTVPNMASYILALATKTILIDWSKYYSVIPLYLETFVDPTRYYGTCYKAANWLKLGSTKGFKKIGSNYINNETPKIYFIYPLNNVLRRQIINLLGEEENGLYISGTH
jgi:hypothetical protein